MARGLATGRMFTYASCVLLTFIALGAFSTSDVSFEEAISLGEKLPSVEAVKSSLAARNAGDKAIGGTLQPTQLTLMPGAAQNTQNERGFEWQANLLQGFNLKNLGGARRKTAQAEREALAQQVRAEALKGRMEAASFWLQLYTLEQLEGLLDSEIKVAEDYVAAVERAFRAGVGTSADVAEAQSSAAELEQERLVVEGLRFEAAAHLAQAMGRPLDAANAHPPLHTQGALPKVSLPSLEELSAYVRSLESLPEIALQKLVETASRARAVEVSAEFAPVLQVGAQFEQTMDKTLIGYGVATLTFDVFGAGAKDTSQARAEAEAASFQNMSSRHKAQTAFVLAVHEVEHTELQLLSLETRVLPAARALREKREALLKAGEGTVFEMLSAKRKETQALLQREKIRGASLWAHVQMMLLLSELQ